MNKKGTKKSWTDKALADLKGRFIEMYHRDVYEKPMRQGEAVELMLQHLLPEQVEAIIQIVEGKDMPKVGAIGSKADGRRK